MRRLNLVLLASLQLCRAKQPSFSIHDDLLAHPQFEVVFSDDSISEPEALAILEASHSRDPTYSADSSSQTDLTGTVRESAAAEVPSGTSSSDDTDDDDEAPIAETYELINGAPWRYLCSVPVIAPPPMLNRTATELAKAEEARELSRASAKGWELMSGLDGQCMYYVQGWWSYSFCYNQGVVQFHAAPTSNTAAAPVPDPKSQEYVLGVVPEDQPDKATGEAKTKSVAPPKAQLQVKGDQRYLMQRLEGGTICDLTGRPRTIEVQYHCSPNASGDRIGWIKEVTTCTYLMLVETPRLCVDVAFQPPKQTRAHPIRCRRVIGSEEEESAWHYHQRVEAGESLGVAGTQKGDKAKEGGTNPFLGTTIGGVVVGGQKVLGGTGEDGKPAHKLPPPRHVATTAKYLGQIIASKQKDGTELSMSDEELNKLELDVKKVEEMREKLIALAGDGGWTIEVVEAAGGELKLLGAFDKKEKEADDGAGETKQAQGQKGGQKAAGEKTGEKQPAGKQEEEQDGSQEEFYKEEL